MNTVAESPQPDPNLNKILDQSAEPADNQIAALQDEIESLKNKHAEDKFIWFLGAIAIVDIVALLHAENWAGPVVIGVIELIAILVMADRCRVDAVAPLIDKITGAFTTMTRRGSGE